MAMATRQWPARRPADERSGMDAIVTASPMREVNEEERMANDSITVRCAASIQPTWRKRTVDEREVREEDFPFCFSLGIRVPYLRVIRSLQAGLENRYGRFRRSRFRIPPSPLAFVVVRPTALRAPRPGYPPAPACWCFSCSDTVRFLRWHNPSRSAEHAQQPRNPSRKPPRATRRLPPVSRSSLARPRPLILASTRVQYEQSAWMRAAVMESPHLKGSIRPAGLRGELLGSNAVPPQHSYPWKPKAGLDRTTVLVLGLANDTAFQRA